MDENSPTRTEVAATRRLCLSYGQLACLLFVSVSIVVTVFGRDQRSGWILMTSPVGALTASNPMLGYSFLHGDDPFMKECIPSVAQIGLFSGSTDAAQGSEFIESFRYLRSLYGLLAALLTPLLGPIYAMLIVNYIGWLLAAWLTWRLTLDLFDDQLAATLAVVLVSGGTGMIAHIGDYSPHLIAFTSYYFGIWLLNRFHISESRVPLRVHITLGVVFAAISMIYNTGIMLLVVYLLFAVWRNPWYYVAPVVMVTAAVRPLQRITLGSAIGDVGDVEAAMLKRSLSTWGELFSRSPTEFLSRVAESFSEFLTFDTPVVVVLGVAACLTTRLPRMKYMFGLATFAVPFLCSLVFVPTAGARGYLVYPVSIWLYVGLARAAANSMRNNSRTKQVAAAVLTIAVFASHFGWSSAHFAYQLGPLKTYFLGWDDGLVHLINRAALAVSLTGNEPTPVLFGGVCGLDEAGAFQIANERSVKTSFRVALRTRMLFFGTLGVLAILTTHGSFRIRLLLCVTAIWVGGAAASRLTFNSVPRFFSVDSAVKLLKGQTLRYDIQLSAELPEALRQACESGDSVVLYVGNVHFLPIEVRASVAGEPIVTQVTKEGYLFYLATEDGTSVADLLSKRRELTVEITNATSEDILLAGWQRSTLPGRRVQFSPPWTDGMPIEVLPAVELRLVRPSGDIKVVGF